MHSFTTLAQNLVNDTRARTSSKTAQLHEARSELAPRRGEQSTRTHVRHVLNILMGWKGHVETAASKHTIQLLTETRLNLVKAGYNHSHTRSHMPNLGMC